MTYLNQFQETIKSLKIKKIEINNFKVFENKIIDFEDSGFIVFDGPNGFGKTSFYDAAELLFTGTIRRYNKLSDITIDGRSTFIEHPYLSSKAKSGDLYIKCHILIDGKNSFLMRKAERNHLKQVTKIKDAKFELFELSSFEDNEGTKIENEEEYLTGILGVNYISNFEYLNYIEQEENAYYLKSKDKDKKDAISHLFNTKEFEDQIDKLDKLEKNIIKLCNALEKTRLERAKATLEETKKKLSTEVNECEYEKIVDWKDSFWDKDKIDFSITKLADLVGVDGKLSKIKNLLINKDTYYKKEKNKKLDDILGNEDLLKNFLTYYSFFDKYNDFKKLNDNYKEIDKFIEEINKNVLESLRENKLLISDKLKSIVEKTIDIEEYNTKRNAIISNINSLNNVESIITELKKSREALIKKFGVYRETAEQKGICPLCSYNWENIEAYDKNVTEQTRKLENISNKQGKELGNIIEDFSGKHLKKIEKTFVEYKQINKFDATFFKKFEDIYTSKEAVEEVKNKIELNGIKYKDILNNEFKIPTKNKLENLKIYIAEKKETLGEGIIKSYFDDIYINEFDNNKDNLDKISLENLDKKINYIKYSYAIYQNDAIKKMEENYEKEKTIYDNAKKIKEKLYSIKKVYKESLDAYHKKVIEDIEILFHIYSGRIAQDYQDGLGLFIINDNGIKFVEKPDKSYDAIFNMSTGQLSTLIISFTLALNKKYSKNKILLIDDPVQTLDDLNVASFIDVLRNDFADRQILISTHEDMMSAFMRYKFEKFGIDSKRINLREL